MGLRPGRPFRRAGLNGVLFVRHATSAGMREARFPAGGAGDAGGLAGARALAGWLGDPCAAPHGGESRRDLMARVGAWLWGRPSGVAVCDAGVIRAALCHALGLDAAAADGIDLAPLRATRLTAARDGWRVAHVNAHLDPKVVP